MKGNLNLTSKIAVFTVLAICVLSMSEKILHGWCHSIYL